MGVLFGEIVQVDAGRATVKLAGYESDGVIEAVLLQAGGGSSVKTWIPPQAGDVVAVAYDEERPEDSAVLGGVYTDAQTPPKTGANIALQAPSVYLGESMSGIQRASRDDHLQDELTAIKNELDQIAAAFGKVQTALAGLGVVMPDPFYTPGYTVGQTAADSVWVK